MGFNSGDVVALNANDGEEIWRSREIEVSVKRLFADANHLYVTCLGPLGVLDLVTGKLLWRTKFPVLEAVVDGARNGTLRPGHEEKRQHGRGLLHRSLAPVEGSGVGIVPLRGQVEAFG